MKGKTEISRKNFIKALGYLLMLPLAGAWFFMARKTVSHRENLTMRINIDSIPQGTGLSGKIITVRKEDKIEILSTTCTHLGCRITKQHNDILVCPCHGSRFSASTGNVLKGPAENNLKQLEFTRSGNQIIVKLYS